MRLLEALSRTRFQVFSYPDGDNYIHPQGVGSGFMFYYKNTLFFVTADHVMHSDDYENLHRIGKESEIAIYNNVLIKNTDDNLIASVVTPLQGVYFFEKGNFAIAPDKMRPFDVAFKIMTKVQLQYPFKTCFVPFEGGNDVAAGLDKIPFTEQSIITPDNNHTYFILGRIRPSVDVRNPQYILTDMVLKSGLVYLKTDGDFHVLYTNTTITYEDWGGLSGSPVLSDDGALIGIICSVQVGGHELNVLNIHKVLPLMEAAIIQEKGTL